MASTAEWRTIAVDDNNSCGELVTRWVGGITAADLYKYNPTNNMCSTLHGQSRTADGSCFAYQIKWGGNCNNMATAHGLTNKDLEGLRLSLTRAL